MEGAWRLGGREIDFTATQAHVLNVMAQNDRVVPRAASAPVIGLVGRPDRREEIVVPGGHATFGTGRSAFRHTLPSIAEWIGSHSDACLDTKGPDGDQTHRRR
jgi:polyhydroxyalkanoate synthase